MLLLKEESWKKSKNKFQEFREKVYLELFDYRADALMNLLDALSSNLSARTVVELSLNGLFEREYGSVYDGIKNYNWKGADEVSMTINGEEVIYSQSQLQCHLVCGLLPEVGSRGFHLISLDGVPMSRLHSETLEDRSYVYSPTGVPGQKPLTVGYKNASLVYLPENEGGTKWVVPLMMSRLNVREDETEQSKGIEQLSMLLSMNHSPFKAELVVAVSDSNYSNAKFLYPLLESHKNLVNINRCRASRVFYWPADAVPEGEKKPRGKPKVYGERFVLKDAETWGEPDESCTFERITASGKKQEVVLDAWSGLLMRGKKEMPMSHHQLTLVRVRIYGSDGKLLYKRPMWLLVSGQRQGELSLVQIYQSYLQRFDQEHYFRFSKQNLLFNRFESTNLQFLHNWGQLTMLAYTQLWLAKDLAQWMPRPWEQYLPTAQTQDQHFTPSQVLRDMSRIIQDLGTPAAPSKPRGYSPGRSKGQTQTPRKRYRIYRKNKKAAKAA